MDESSTASGVIDAGLFDLLVRVSRQSAAYAASKGTAQPDQLALLRASDLITDEQHAAGVRWRRDWLEHGHSIVDAADYGAAQAARIQAAVRCRNVRNGIGRVGEMLLVMMLIDGNSPDVIEASPSPDAGDATAARDMWREGCITVIRQLTERYRVLDQTTHV